MHTHKAILWLSEPSSVIYGQIGGQIREISVDEAKLQEGFA